MLSIIRHTPLSCGKSRRHILNFIKKHIDHPIITDFRGVPFILNLDNTTEAKALFGRYNLKELAFMKSMASSYPQPVFVDVGANSGFYTQNFLAIGRGLALAIEPNPAMCQRIKDNHVLFQKERLDYDNKLIVECCAVGESSGVVELDLSQGLGCAHVVDQKEEYTIPVKMDSLLNILKRHEIDRISVMKIDIEGYEDRALTPFFTKADRGLFPHSIIIEHTSSDRWGGDLFSILKNCGYITVGKTRGNLLLRLASCMYATYGSV